MEVDSQRMSSASTDQPVRTDQTVAEPTPSPLQCERLASAVPEELVCEVCLGIISEPKMLDCAHSFCRVCLYRLLTTSTLRRRSLLLSPSSRSLSRIAEANGANAVSQSSGADDESPSENEITCPTCSRVTVVPAGDVDQLSTSVAMSKLLAISSSVLGADADQEELRRNIRLSRASSFSPLSSKQLSLCADHSSVQEFYCVQCKVLVCGHCMLSGHKMHIDQVKSAQEAQDRMMAGLRSLMQPSQEVVSMADEVSEKISDLKKGIVQGSTVSSNHIKQFFNQARELLAEREAELVAMVDSKSLRVLSELTRKEEVVRRNLAMLSRHVDQVRATLQQPGDMAMLTSTHGMVASVEDSQKHIREVALAVSQKASFTVMFQGTQIDFTGLGSLSGDHEEIVGEAGYVIIKGAPPFPTARRLSQQRSGSSIGIPATIKECQVYSTAPVEPVYEEPAKTYSQLPPKLPPRISPIHQSTKRRNVTVTLKHIIPCDSQAVNLKPFGIAVGEMDAVIVSDIHSRCVKVLARSGRVIDTITGPQSPQQIYGPVCLTTDSEGQLYILDKEGKRSLHRFKNGNFDSTFTHKASKSQKLSQPWGIAVSDDLIYVTDWQKSCIHIFHTNGKFKDSLGSGQQGQKVVLKHPVGIAVMPNGNLVVADHDSHCLWKVVHTKDMVEFQQIGSDNVLDSPYGVAITQEGFIVVTDTGNSQVCLFSPTGNFITHLGKKGSGRGEFNLPRHVCTNSRGEILVADEGNQRVQIFEISNLRS